jgi:hypothetical protein
MWTRIRVAAVVLLWHSPKQEPRVVGSALDVYSHALFTIMSIRMGFQKRSTASSNCPLYTQNHDARALEPPTFVAVYHDWNAPG